MIESGVTEEMMTGLDELGVVGLGVLAEGLRKPVGVERPIVGLQDWQGITFATVASNGQTAAISALGATPEVVFGSARDEALDRVRSRASSSTSPTTPVTPGCRTRLRT